MKKNLLALALICSGTFAFAQTIPNSGFESWTNMGNYSDPDSWGTLNSTTDLAGVYTVTQGPGNPGTYCVKITSKTVFTTVVPGIAATGVINVANQTVTGGFPFTSRPANLTGSWQYMSMSAGDQGSIIVLLSKWNTTTNSRDTIASTNYLLPGMVMAWANFSLPLTYASTATPDTCLIILASSNATPAANSYLWVDNLAFAGSVGISESSVSPTMLSVYPNPSESFINISFSTENNSSVKIQLVDLTGKVIREMNSTSSIGENSATMELEGIAKGIYFLRLETSNSMETKKINIQ